MTIASRSNIQYVTEFCVEGYTCGDVPYCTTHGGCDFTNCVSDPDVCFAFEVCWDYDEPGGGGILGGGGWFPENGNPPSGGGGGVGGGTPPRCPGEISRSSFVPNCGPGWIPISDRNELGFLYSRIAELNDSIAANPFRFLDCDSLNVMPLDPVTGFGKMFQAIAQYDVPAFVKDRIDSIRNVLPGWIVDDYNIQSLEEAYGGVVNCDFFPVRITSLPPGFTPESLVEYFRTHLNTFISPTVGVQFYPYYQGTIFNDSVRFYSPYQASVGALIHVDMANDGSVVESGYSNLYNSPTESHHFTVTTMETVADFEHPVAGNRRWGIYSVSTAPGEFTFYTMAVDRMWDWWTVQGSNLMDWATGTNGFEQADVLWSNMQTNMINFIVNAGGSASYYSKKNVIARPKWDDVKDFLRGIITYPVLMQRLGC